MLPLSPPNRSVRRKLAPFRSHLDLGDHLLEHCRVVLYRLEAAQWRDALYHPARPRRCNQAAGVLSLGFLGRLRLLAHAQETVERVAHRKGAYDEKTEERREEK